MRHTPILIAAIIAICFVSCKNSTTGLPVPKDASMVVHINASSLTSKLPWKDIQASDWFKDAYSKEEDSLTKKLMDDPGNSGIDVKSDFVFFMRKQNNGGYVVFEGKLKDARAFEAIVKKNSHNAEVKQNGDLNYLKDEGTTLVSWTNSKFFLMSDAPFGTPTTTNWDEYDKNRFHQDSLIVFTKNLLSLSSDNSIESDKRFTSLIKENGDLHFWMNMGQYMSALPNAMNNGFLLSMMQGLSNLFEGSISTGTLNFDDGKITVHTKRYLNDKMKQLMEKYPYKNITTEQVNKIPSNDVDAALIVNYPPEMSKELFKTLGIDGFINGFLGKYNTNLDEVVQAMNGNLILSVSDFGYSTTQKSIPGSSGQMYAMPEPNVKVLFAMSINNKPVFDKLFSIIQKQIPDSEIASKINYKTSNDWFAVSNKPEAVGQFLAGSNSKQSFASKITGHPFGAYVDLQRILKAGQSNPFLKIDTAATNMWQDIVATGGDYKDGVITGEFTLNLVDKNTNSLKQLNQFANRMYLSAQKRQQEYMRDYSGSDSLATIPPVPDTSAVTH
jgi:hypothetical protein